MKVVTNLIASVVLIVCLPFIVLGVVVLGLAAIWGKGKGEKAVRAQGEGPTMDTFGVN